MLGVTLLTTAAVGTAVARMTLRRRPQLGAGMWDAVREAVRGHFTVALERERRTTMLCLLSRHHGPEPGPLERRALAAIESHGERGRAE